MVIMKITPAWRVYILGATLCVALTICSRNFGDRGGPYFMASLTLAGIVYLLAIREFFATPRFPRRVVVIGLDRKSTRLNSSHGYISYAVFCLKKKNTN